MFSNSFLGLALCGIAAGEPIAGPAFARIFGDHMVLPMNRPVPLWGTAAPDSEVTLEISNKSLVARSDSSGRWKAVVPPMPAQGRGMSVRVRSTGGSAVIEDVLFGRVLLCSGQSNMDFPLSRAIGGRQEAAGAGRFTSIRLCNWTGVRTDPHVYQNAELARLNPGGHFQGVWKTAESAAEISAVAWWSARMLHERSGVPVGIIENAVGGSPMEAWLPDSVLRSRSEYAGLLGPKWLDFDRMSPWARGRVRENLGTHMEADHPFRPGFLFESGVRPWCGIPLDAVIWYQGETNAEVDDEAWHLRMIKDLVVGWRRELGDERLPFVMVQLPRIGGSDPLRKYWPGFRRAQAGAADSVSGVKLIQTMDLGWDSPDVHPPDKLPVAERVAAALVEILK